VGGISRRLSLKDGPPKSKYTSVSKEAMFEKL
jgi:hypothetical protein